MIERISLLIIFSILLIISTGFISAEEREMEQEEVKLSVSVDHVANGLEKLGEKISLYFKFSEEKKLRFKKLLVEKRLAELKYVSNSKKIDLIEETASRYSTYLSIFIDEALSKKLIKKDELIEMIDNHTKVIEKVQQSYKFETGWWLAIQHDINILKLSLGKIKDI